MCWNSRRNDCGASVLEYGAVIVLVAVIAAVVFGAGIPGRIAAAIETAIGSTGSGAGTDPGTAAGEPGYGNRSNPDPREGATDSVTDPRHPDYQGPPPAIRRALQPRLAPAPTPRTRTPPRWKQRSVSWRSVGQLA